jgi:sporulation-control protein spo0M
LQQAVLEAVQNLEFILYQVENEHDPRKGHPRPFVQQLGFRPTGGPYAGHVEELELVFKMGPDALDVLVELDRRARSLGGFLESAMELNERCDRLQDTRRRAAWRGRRYARPTHRGPLPLNRRDSKRDSSRIRVIRGGVQ